jgi:hypothetical protein
VKRFVCVDVQKAAGFPVTSACEAAGVSTSGYYDWAEREAAGPTERELAEAEPSTGYDLPRSDPVLSIRRHHALLA